MKKRAISFMMALSIIVSGLSVGTTSVSAAEKNKLYDDSVVQWYGTTDDMPTTFDSLFDEDGLRKVSYYESESSEDEKFGIVNKKGEFVVPPIYDEIKVYYVDQGIIGTYFMPMQVTTDLFMFGYTQAKRDGKMGLLNTDGEEVVPCQYDAVGLPSEGICRVFKDGKLGYYDLNKNKELVAPKYPMPSEFYSKSNPTNVLNDSLLIPEDPNDANGFKKSVFDFNGGYALVPLSDKDQSDNYSCIWKVQIIDTKGKEILPDKNGYNCKLNVKSSGYGNAYSYPQNGSYLVNAELSKKYYVYHYTTSDCGICEKMKIRLWEYGLVSPEKVILKPQYCAGINGDSSHPLHILYSRDFSPILLPDSKTLIVPVDPKFSEILDIRLVDFSGKVLHEFPDEASLSFYPELNAIKVSTPDGNAYMIDQKGKKLDYIIDQYETNGLSNYATTKDGYVYNLKTKKKLFKESKFGKLKALPYMSNTLAIFEKDKKYSLVDLTKGKAVVKGCSKITDYSHNGTPFFVVEKGGKSGIYDKKGKKVLDCKYKNIAQATKTNTILNDVDYAKLYHDRGKVLNSEKYVILTDSNDIQSLYNLETKETVLTLSKGQTFKLSTTDSKHVSLDKKNVIDIKNTDKSTTIYNIDTGKAVYTSNAEYFNAGNYIYGGLKEISLGDKKYSNIGTDGKIVYYARQPKTHYLDEVFGARTPSLVFVKSGNKLGYIPSNLMAHPTKAKKPGDTKKTTYGQQDGFVKAVTAQEFVASGRKLPNADGLVNPKDEERETNISIKNETPVIVSASHDGKKMKFYINRIDGLATFEMNIWNDPGSGYGTKKIQGQLFTEGDKMYGEIDLPSFVDVNKNFYFQVTGYSSGRKSNTKNSSKFTCRPGEGTITEPVKDDTATPEPIKIKKLSSPESKQVSVDWTEYAGAAYYEIAYKRKTTSGNGVSKSFKATSTSATLSLTYGNTEYVIRVRALDSSKNAISDWTAWTAVMIK